ncbi:DUF2335 domain-containing protein [Sphingomonas lacusdianchii]|uniref:DUF2335 domain-containing protein n=1 Tax=Sphingomonas lacusdianchii TaxID=2917992 RepID=UPI001F595005|nr:DUF2335 domain-containing protein [Sphingomonas sp. JXJ CY 53]
MGDGPRPDDRDGRNARAIVPDRSSSSEEEAVERVEAILEPFEPEVRREIVERTMLVHQGPLPPASLLRDYDAVVPGLAREIADGAAEERRFRHAMVRRTGTQEFILNIAGLAAMLIALVLMLGIVAYMVASGEAKAGAALGGAIIVGVTVALSNYRKAQGTRETVDKPEE